MIFYSKQFLDPSRTLQLEGHTLSAICNCLISTFAATLHIWSYLLIHNLSYNGERVPLDIGKAKITKLNTTTYHITCILTTFINAELDKCNQCLDLETHSA
jgi:hypothetical protein